MAEKVQVNADKLKVLDAVMQKMKLFYLMKRPPFFRRQF